MERKAKRKEGDEDIWWDINGPEACVQVFERMANKKVREWALYGNSSDNSDMGMFKPWMDDKKAMECGLRRLG